MSVELVLIYTSVGSKSTASWHLEQLVFLPPGVVNR